MYNDINQTEGVKFLKKVPLLFAFLLLLASYLVAVHVETYFSFDETKVALAAVNSGTIEQQAHLLMVEQRRLHLMISYVLMASAFVSFVIAFLPWAKSLGQKSVPEKS